MPRYLFTYPKDDNDFRPNQRPIKAPKIIRKKKQPKNYNRNGWDEDENRKYRQFLETHSELLINRELRREKKVFLRLSQYVETRDANQCRSHHQKMIQKYQSIDRVLEFLRYLEAKDDNTQKELSTCQVLDAVEPNYQAEALPEIDELFQLGGPEDSFNNMCANNDIDKYLNFMEEDIWLN